MRTSAPARVRHAGIASLAQVGIDVGRLRRVRGAVPRAKELDPGVSRVRGIGDELERLEDRTRLFAIPSSLSAW
jgi:hypothetical protein